MSSDRRTNRANSFDLVRLVFAVAVIYSHSFPLLLGEAHGYRNELVYRATHGQDPASEFAVAGFFVISGFLITQSWLHSPRLLPFLRRRAARIYPGFLVVSLACALVFEPLGADHFLSYLRHEHWHGAIYQAFTLQMPVGKPDVLNSAPHPHYINGSLWTIRYEVAFYLLVAALGCAKALRKPALLALFFVSFCLYALPYLSGELAGKIHWDYLNYVFRQPSFLPRWAVFFSGGMVFASLGGDLLRNRTVACVAALALAGTSLFGALWIALPLAGTYLLLFIALRPSRIANRLTCFGDFSYGLYIWAFPVQQLMVKYCSEVSTPNRLFIASSAVTLPLAVASWYLIERPFLKRRYPKPEPSVPHVPVELTLGPITSLI